MRNHQMGKKFYHQICRTSPNIKKIFSIDILCHWLIEYINTETHDIPIIWTLIMERHRIISSIRTIFKEHLDSFHICYKWILMFTLVFICSFQFALHVKNEKKCSNTWHYNVNICKVANLNFCYESESWVFKVQMLTWWLYYLIQFWYFIIYCCIT